jgi:hypothetical protein
MAVCVWRALDRLAVRLAGTFGALLAPLAARLDDIEGKLDVVEEFRLTAGGHLMRLSGRVTDLEKFVPAVLDHLHEITATDVAFDEDGPTQPIRVCAPVVTSVVARGRAAVPIAADEQADVRDDPAKRRRRRRGRGSASAEPVLGTYLDDAARAVELGRELERERLRRAGGGGAGPEA